MLSIGTWLTSIIGTDAACEGLSPFSVPIRPVDVIVRTVGPLLQLRYNSLLLGKLFDDILDHLVHVSVKVCELVDTPAVSFGELDGFSFKAFGLLFFRCLVLDS